MNLKRQLPALVMAGGLALVGAACDAQTTDGTSPGVTDPVQDPAGGGGEDLGGTEGGEDLGG